MTNKQEQQPPGREPLKCFNVRLPHHLWRLATLDKVDTGESINALIVRLLAAYYQPVE